VGRREFFLEAGCLTHDRVQDTAGLVDDSGTFGSVVAEPEELVEQLARIVLDGQRLLWCAEGQRAAKGAGITGRAGPTDGRAHFDGGEGRAAADVLCGNLVTGRALAGVRILWRDAAQPRTGDDAVRVRTFGGFVAQARDD